MLFQLKPNLPLSHSPCTLHSFTSPLSDSRGKSTDNASCAKTCQIDNLGFPPENSVLAGVCGGDAVAGSNGHQLADEPSGGADPRRNPR
ncbi:uncharacterized protein DS421_14g451930 [Arachis hypogaea]|nr:uncharacterized protein DS421_14g451930 [Arachis hypogaea]